MFQDVSVCMNQCNSIVFKQFTSASQTSYIPQTNFCCLIWKRSLQHFLNVWDLEKRNSYEMPRESKKSHMQIYSANSVGLLLFLENQDTHQNIKYSGKSLLKRKLFIIINFSLIQHFLKVIWMWRQNTFSVMYFNIQQNYLFAEHILKMLAYLNVLFLLHIRCYLILTV